MANKNYSIAFNAELKKDSLQTAVKKEESKLQPLTLKARIESSTGVTGLSGKSAKTSAQSIKEFDKASKSVDNFRTKLTNLKTQGALNDKQFEDFSKTLDGLYNNFKHTDSTFGEFTDGMHKLKNEVSQTTTATKAHGQSITEIIGKYVTWLGIATLVASVMNAVRGVINNVKELDASMVELNKVYDASQKELNDVKEQAFELAEAIGSTGKNVIDATTEFKRMGYTIEESLELAKVASIMVNVAEGINDAGEAANILTSILKGTNTEIKYAQSLLDRLNEISNNSSISFDALAHMTQEAAATMKILGNNLDETMGLLTGAYEILQDESVANGIQTIGLRIGGLNEDLESVSGLSNQVVEALQKYAGIKAFDEQSGQLRSTYDILKELAGVWDEIDKNQQSALLNVLAGKRQADVAAAILENWEGVEDAVLQAQNSMNSALEENARAMQSIEGAQKRLTNAQQEFSDKLLQSGIIEGLLDMATAFTDFVTGILTFIDNAPKFVKFLTAVISGLASLALVIAIVKNAWKGPTGMLAAAGAVVTALGSLAAVSSLVKESQEDLQKESEETAEVYYDLSKSFEENIKSVNNYENALNLLEQRLSGIKVEFQNQIDLLKEKQEQEKKDKELQEKLLAVEKARQALEEARQRKVRVFRAGVGFIYDEDTSEIQTAQESLQESINQLSEYKYDLALDRAEEFINKLNTLLSEDKILEGWENLFSNFGDLLDTEFSNYLLETDKFVKTFNNLTEELQLSPKEKNTETKAESEGDDRKWYSFVADVGRWARKGITSIGKSIIKGKLASGTTNAVGGLTMVGEHGPEFVNLPQGSEVLSHNRSMKLHSIVNNPSAYLGSSSNGGGKIIQFNGPLNFPNVKNSSDAEGFINAVIRLGNNSIPKLN